MDEDAHGRYCHFSLQEDTGTRVYYLRAADDAERTAWMKAIKNNLSALRGESTCDLCMESVTDFAAHELVCPSRPVECTGADGCGQWIAFNKLEVHVNTTCPRAWTVRKPKIPSPLLCVYGRKAIP